MWHYWQRKLQGWTLEIDDKPKDEDIKLTMKLIKHGFVITRVLGAR